MGQAQHNHAKAHPANRSLSLSFSREKQNRTKPYFLSLSLSLYDHGGTRSGIGARRWPTTTAAGGQWRRPDRGTPFPPSSRITLSSLLTFFLSLLEWRHPETHTLALARARSRAWRRRRRRVPGERRAGGVPLQAIWDTTVLHGPRHHHAGPRPPARPLPRAPLVARRHRQVPLPPLLRARLAAPLPAPRAPRQPCPPRRRVRPRRHVVAAAAGDSRSLGGRRRRWQPRRCGSRLGRRNNMCSCCSMRKHELSRKTSECGRLQE